MVQERGNFDRSAVVRIVNTVVLVFLRNLAYLCQRMISYIEGLYLTSQSISIFLEARASRLIVRYIDSCRCSIITPTLAIYETDNSLSTPLLVVKKLVSCNEFVRDLKVTIVIVIRAQDRAIWVEYGFVTSCWPKLAYLAMLFILQVTHTIVLADLPCYYQNKLRYNKHNRQPEIEGIYLLQTVCGTTFLGQLNICFIPHCRPIKPCLQC